MGQVSRTILWLIVALACTMFLPDGKSAKVSATGKNFKYAGYRKDGNPQFILYGKKGRLDGTKVKVNNVLVDIFKDHCTNIEAAHDFHDLKLYKINESYKNILTFWEDKALTDCFISTDNATFDQSTNTVKGDDMVRLRSKAMDVNGVGFDADYLNKKIHIRSKVNVVIRVDLFKSAEVKSKKKKEQ